MVWIGKLFADNEGNAYMERCAYIYDPEVETKDACLSISNDFGIGLAKGFIYPLGEHMNAIIAELMTAANE